MDDIRASPAFGPALIAVVVFTWMAADEAGFSPTTWYPAGLILLGLLVVSLIALPTPRPSRATLLAMGALAAYAAWSYLSITWAGQKGVAWEGANRTAVYAVTLALFALWPWKARAAAIVAGGVALAVAAIGLVVLVKANAAEPVARYFFEGRLKEPAGYVNANVALWCAALWPCVVLAGRPELAAPLRGLFLAAAGVLLGLSILGQSRGWVVALPVLVLVAVLIVPGRVRTLLLFALVAIAGAAMAGPVLDVYDASAPGEDLGAALSDATRAMLLACLGLAIAGTLFAVVDRRISVGETTARRGDRIALAVVAAGLLVGLVAFSAAVGNPVTKASDYWDEFKEGGTTPSAGEARLTVTAATDRYDFWRVGMEMFSDDPLTGQGADNFQQEYFLRGNGDQQPRYPHSLEVRVLAQTGLVGALLLGCALVAGVVAAVPAMRGRRDLGAATAAAALLALGYWLAHGSLDWFWEFAGLGAPAFAMLGLAAGLGDGVRGAGARLPGGVLAGVAGAVVAAVLALSFAGPWFAERYIEQAGQTWRTDQGAAFEALDRAASLDPLSAKPALTAGTINVHLGRLDSAIGAFENALERDPRDGYANLMLGAIASERGRRREALRHLRRAVALTPRYDVAQRALRRVERGQRLRADKITREIVRATRARVGLG